MARTKPIRSPLPTAVPPQLRPLQVRHDEIHPSKINPRTQFDAAALNELADSIAAHGLEQPLLVRHHPDKNGEFEIIAGERRWRAIGILRERMVWPEGRLVDANLRDDVSDTKALELAIVENLQRVDINPMDEARALDSLRQLEPDTYSNAHLAAMIGKTPEFVQQRLRLVTDLAPTARKAVETGAIPFTFARELARVPASQQETFLKALTGKEPGITTVAELKRELEGDRVALDIATFDTAPHAANVVTDGKGRKWFADKKRFVELQTDAAKERAKVLRKEGWGWAEVETGYWYSGAFQEMSKGGDKSKAGCVIVLDRWSGKVKEHTGLVKRPERSYHGGASRPSKEQRDRERLKAEAEKRRLAATKPLAARIADSIARDPDLALRLIAFNMLSGFCGSNMAELHVAHDGRSALDTKDGRAAEFAPLFAAYIKGATGNHQPEDRRRLWSAIGGVGKSELPRLLAQMVADGVDVSTGIGLQPKLDPLLAGVCEHIGAPLDVSLNSLKRAKPDTHEPAAKPEKPTKGRKGKRRSQTAAPAKAAPVDTAPPPGEPVVTGATIAARMGCTVEELLDPGKRRPGTAKVPTGDAVDEDDLTRLPGGLRREATAR